MLYSKCEYSLTEKTVEGKNSAQDFLTDDEEVLYTFESDEAVAFFTNKKVIFVCSYIDGVCETEVLSYQGITRCIVLGSPKVGHGKLEIVVSGEIFITFYLPQYLDAVKLCRTILG